MKLKVSKEWCKKAAELEGDSEVGAGYPPMIMTTGQKMLYRKHGTPAEFAKACYECVPGEISMDEARAAIEKYNQEWNDARRIS